MTITPYGLTLALHLLLVVFGIGTLGALLVLQGKTHEEIQKVRLLLITVTLSVFGVILTGFALLGIKFGAAGKPTPQIYNALAGLAIVIGALAIVNFRSLPEPTADPTTHLSRRIALNYAMVACAAVAIFILANLPA